MSSTSAMAAVAASLCQAFPTLFDLVDESKTMEVDGVAKADYAKVVEQCYLCDLCYQTKCPYVPPHPWNVDFPHLMLRAKAAAHERGETTDGCEDPVVDDCCRKTVDDSDRRQRGQRAQPQSRGEKPAREVARRASRGARARLHVEHGAQAARRICEATASAPGRWVARAARSRYSQRVTATIRRRSPSRISPPCCATTASA